MRGELTEQRLILGRERAFGLAQEIECADDFALAAHWNRQLRQHVAERSPIARLATNVVDENRPTLLHGSADDALADGKPLRAQDLLGIADGDDAEILSLFIEQVDRKRAESCQPGNELRNLRQQLVEIEHRGDLLPKFEQRRQQFGITGGPIHGLNGQIGWVVRGLGH